MFRLASTPARCAGAPASSRAASGVPFTAASIRDGSAIILRMSLGCGLRLSRWASIRRGPSVKNSFSYSFSGRNAAAMVAAVSSRSISSPSPQYGQRWSSGLRIKSPRAGE